MVNFTATPNHFIMKKTLLILALTAGFGSKAQTPLFTPYSNISPVGDVDSPYEEQYYNIIDGSVETKFLDFYYYDGLGFIVNLNGARTVATSMDFSTANDSSERDPMNYEISGSNDGNNYSVITTGSIDCNDSRYFTRNYTFQNTVAYSYYKFNFTDQCNTIEQMIQISEVQLRGTVLKTDDFSIVDNVEIYPNPSNGNFNVLLKNQLAIDEISITDALGKTIQTESLKNTDKHKIAMQGASAGIYFVKIKSGEISMVKKLIIK